MFPDGLGAGRPGTDLPKEDGQIAECFGFIRLPRLKLNRISRTYSAHPLNTTGECFSEGKEAITC
jgi:hypothetical protein